MNMRYFFVAMVSHNAHIFIWYYYYNYWL